MRDVFASLIRTMRNQIRTMATSIALFCFPLLRAESLADCTSITNLFFEKRTIQALIQQFALLATFSIINVSALQLPVPATFWVLRAPIYGVMGYRTSVLAAFATLQTLAVRIWLFMLIKKHRSVSNIGFLQLLKQLGTQSQAKILFWTKLISVNLATVAYLYNVIHICIELLVSHDLWRYLFISFHAIMIFMFMRASLNDVLVLYVYGLAGCSTLLEQMKSLRGILKEYDHFAHSKFSVIQQYFFLIESITHLNPLSKFIVLASELLVVPFGSMIFIFSSSPAEGIVQLTLKAVILTAASVYALHGYLLIVVFAQVNTMSKVLCADINSVIARRRKLTWYEVKQLLLIIEDSSSSRSNMIIHEYSGSVTQMDAFESITSTLSIMTLLFTFRGISS